MKSQVSYKSRYALLTKGRRLATLKRSPIESSDLNDSYSKDKPVNYLLLCCFLAVASGLSRRLKGHLPSLGKELSKAGEFSEEYGMYSMALNMDSSGKLG
jgi:hypothetical protein